MRMDTETISYVLEGHELQNDVQTMIQVFLANRHYIRTDTVTDAEITELLTKGQTGVIKGFNSKEGKPFSAAVAFDGDFNTVFVFPDVKNNRNSKRKKK